MKILVFGAHPDDMEIGMGGTIAKHTNKGDKVLMVVVTVPNQKEVRKKESKNAARVLGAELKILDLNPEELVFDRKLVREFDKIIESFKPDVIYTQWNNDSHQDHNFVANAAIASSRKNECSVYMYEQTIPGGIGPNGFRAQLYINISNEIELKLRSVEAHKSQLKLYGNDWSYGIKARAQFRGYQINTKFAEAFEVIKEIRR